jgi:hypothetical protein
MYITFLSATILLAAFLVLRYVEVARGARVAAHARARLDTSTLTLEARMHARVTVVREYVSRDMLVKVLHMLTYAVLMFVRLLERKLTGTVRLLRSFRKKKPARGISPGLDKVVRGVDHE